jgi:hypothetical protein
MDEKVQSVVSAPRNYHFDSNTVDKWLDGWFEKSVREELAKL